MMRLSPSLNRYFLDEGIENLPGESQEEELLQLLQRHIAWLLDEKPERLMQIFYRLDVSETKVRQVLREKPDGEWALELARLVVEREKIRLYWREKYQNPEG
jgi:hypothetical protein